MGLELQTSQEVRPPAAGGSDKPARLVALDAYRGFIMMLLVGGGFGLRDAAKNFPDSAAWRFLGHQFEHVAWTGFAFWDLIQPAFLFMVGVAIPYSYAARKARGDSDFRIRAHAAYRSVVLIFLGVFLSSNYVPQGGRTNWVFVNVLTVIGFGYFFVFLLRGRGVKVQLAALAAVFIGDWLLFALYPAPGPDFDYAAVNVPDGFEKFTGFFAHWNKNSNVAGAFDRWFLNLFPRPKPYVGADGWQTLNFIPSMGTMMIGLMTGEFLRTARPPRTKLLGLVAGGAACVALGWALGQTVCPLVRRVETPSWILFSAGWVLWMLAACYAVIDLAGYQKWAFPLVVLGMNSIALYCTWQLGVTGWVRRTVGVHFGWGFYGGPYGSIVSSLVSLAGAWLIVLWMYRRRIFLRI